MPIEHVDRSAAFDGRLPAPCIACHLSLHFPSPNDRNRLAILMLSSGDNGVVIVSSSLSTSRAKFGRPKNCIIISVSKSPSSCLPVPTISSAGRFAALSNAIWLIHALGPRRKHQRAIRAACTALMLFGVAVRFPGALRGACPCGSRGQPVGMRRDRVSSFWRSAGAATQFAFTGSSGPRPSWTTTTSSSSVPYPRHLLPVVHATLDGRGPARYSAGGYVRDAVRFHSSPLGTSAQRAHLFQAAQHLHALQRSLDRKAALRQIAKMFAAKSLNGRTSAGKDK
jgi:hypothetical protein